MRALVALAPCLALAACDDGLAVAADASARAMDAAVTDHPAALDRADPLDVTASADDVSPDPLDAPRVIAPCDPWSPDAGVSVRGRAYDFGPGGPGLRGAVVRALEHPERCATLDGSGDFVLGGFAPGEDVSVTLEHPDYPPIQTGTHTVPSGGITGITFQAPSYGMYRVMQTATRIVAQRDRCQIATTVTAVGLSLDSPVPSHGVAGATVTIEPTPAEGFGPIYFQYYGPGSILPDRSLTQTTRDGGVLWLNVPAGDYVLTAHEDGMRFTQARFRCRAGWLVNASPPMGLQAVP